MRTITLELSTDGCDSVLAELDTYKRGIEDKLKEVCRRLAEIGAEEAKLWSSAAKFQGNDDVSFSVSPITRGYKLSMSGSDVYFVEFGTGNMAGSYPGDTSGVSVDVRPGTWSETHARQYYDNGYWYYAGTRYEGTAAWMPLYHAGARMRAEMPRIMREVLGG